MLATRRATNVRKRRRGHTVGRAWLLLVGPFLRRLLVAIGSGVAVDGVHAHNTVQIVGAATIAILTTALSLYTRYRDLE
jgi:hypothetical protein